MHGYDPTASQLIEAFPVERICHPLTDIFAMDEVDVARSRVRDGLADAVLCENDRGEPVFFVTREVDLELTHDHVLSGKTAVADAVGRLDSIADLVVRSSDESYGVLARASLNSVVARAWLFGLVTLLEIKLRSGAEMKVVDWREHISPDRLEKAHEIKEERARRGQSMATLDGLQFSDLGSIALKDEELFASLGLESRRAGRKFIKRLESLRNNLAHAQDIVKYDWDTIVMIAKNARRIVAPSA